MDFVFGLPKDCDGNTRIVVFVDRLIKMTHLAAVPDSIDNGLLYCRTDVADTARIVVPHNEDLKYRILFEAHDTALRGHLDREKTYGSVRQHYWWPKLYKWVSTYVRTCETCQRIKPSAHSAAPLASLPVPMGCWDSISMYFVLGLPKTVTGMWFLRTV